MLALIPAFNAACYAIRKEMDGKTLRDFLILNGDITSTCDTRFADGSGECVTICVNLASVYGGDDLGQSQRLRRICKWPEAARTASELLRGVIILLGCEETQHIKDAIAAVQSATA